MNPAGLVKTHAPLMIEILCINSHTGKKLWPRGKDTRQPWPHSAKKRDCILNAKSLTFLTLCDVQTSLFESCGGEGQETVTKTD